MGVVDALGMNKNDIALIKRVQEAGNVLCPCKCDECKQMGPHSWSFHFAAEHRYE